MPPTSPGHLPAPSPHPLTSLDPAPVVVARDTLPPDPGGLTDLSDPVVLDTVGDLSRDHGHSPLFGPVPLTGPLRPWRVAVFEEGEPLEVVPAELTGGTLLRARAGVVARLRDADRILPSPLGLRVLRAHVAAGTSTPCRPFAAFEDGVGVVPEVVDAHRCGAAVDVTLRLGQLPLAMPFDATGHHPGWSDGGSGAPGAVLVRILVHTMQRCGFLAARSAPGHFSYGDQAWAERADESSAPYGPID